MKEKIDQVRKNKLSNKLFFAPNFKNLKGIPKFILKASTCLKFGYSADVVAFCFAQPSVEVT